MVKTLEKLGFEQVRQRGSHVVMQRGAAGCVVLRHRQVKKGTLTGIIRQTGLTVDAFVRATK